MVFMNYLAPTPLAPYPFRLALFLFPFPPSPPQRASSASRESDGEFPYTWLRKAHPLGPTAKASGDEPDRSVIICNRKSEIQDGGR